MNQLILKKLIEKELSCLRTTTWPTKVYDTGHQDGYERALKRVLLWMTMDLDEIKDE